MEQIGFLLLPQSPIEVTKMGEVILAKKEIDVVAFPIRGIAEVEAILVMDVGFGDLQ